MVKPIIEGSKRRFGVAAAEVGHQDLWQRTALGFAAVSARAGHADSVLESVERFALSFPEVEVIETTREHFGTGDA